MVALIVLLGIGVVYLAYRSPSPTDAANSQNPGPNVNLPSLGNVGNPSPAMSGGTPVASQLFRTAMQVNAGIVGNLKGLNTPLSAYSGLAVKRGTYVPPSQTVSEMGKTLMTQAPSPIANPVNTFAGHPTTRPMIKI